MLFLDDGRRPLNERTSVSAIIEFSGRVTEASVSEARKISCCDGEVGKYTLEVVRVTGDLYAHSLFVRGSR